MSSIDKESPTFWNEVCEDIIVSSGPGAPLTKSNLNNIILTSIQSLQKSSLALDYVDFAQRNGNTLHQTAKILVLNSVANDESSLSSTQEKTVLCLISEIRNWISLNSQFRSKYLGTVQGAEARTSLWKNTLSEYLKCDNNNFVDVNREEEEENDTQINIIVTGYNLIQRLLSTKSNFTHNNDQPHNEDQDLKNIFAILNSTKFLTNNYGLRYRQKESIQRIHDQTYELLLTQWKHSKRNLLSFFDFLMKNDVLISWNTARTLRSISHFSVSITNVDTKGLCLSCKCQLDNTPLSSTDIIEIKDIIYKKCLEKEDIYCNSSEEEMKRFNGFLDSMTQYDVVVDGLNIALSRIPFLKKKTINSLKVQSLILLNFLETLQREKKKKNILLIHRKQIKSYPDYNQIKSLATIYEADRYSEDDFFVLLSAMAGGPGTLIATNDRFRQHNWLLLNSKMQRKFTIWQMQHQMFHRIWADILQPRKTTKYHYKFTDPISYRVSPSCMKNGELWHLPIIQSLDETNVHLTIPKDWLCIKSN